jgi:hypothetical protein
VPEELEWQQVKFDWVPKTTHKIECHFKLNVSNKEATSNAANFLEKSHEELLNDKMSELEASRNKQANDADKDLTKKNVKTSETLQFLSGKAKKTPTEQLLDDSSSDDSTKENKIMKSLANPGDDSKNEIKSCPKFEFHVFNEDDQSIDVAMQFERFFWRTV